MKTEALKTVEKMFAAFGSGDLEKFKQTVTEDTIWIYHGTTEIPNPIFEGTEKAAIFLNSILKKTEVLSFEPQQFICDDNMVVVLGQEHQRVKASGQELKQKWVQVYTVENNLITRMEEFATSEVVK
ncbi:MAG: nuclear transport factor 2 family protein [Ginsengibacter sp.]